jgi:hypothetical protein
MEDLKIEFKVLGQELMSVPCGQKLITFNFLSNHDPKASGISSGCFCVNSYCSDLGLFCIDGLAFDINL